jgi:hypothetical protein
MDNQNPLLPATGRSGFIASEEIAIIENSSGQNG